MAKRLPGSSTGHSWRQPDSEKVRDFPVPVRGVPFSDFFSVTFNSIEASFYKCSFPFEQFWVMFSLKLYFI